MPRQVPQSQLNTVLAVAARFPESASLNDIAHELGITLPRRTLQRHLALLVRQNRLMREGHGPSSRYRASAVVLGTPVRPTVHAHDEEAYVPLSAAGETIRKALREPIQNRRPAGYNRKFLDVYRPNKTFYLSEGTRRHLFEMGRSQGNERPAGTYARQILGRLLIDLSWNSSRLEGNTYSLLETERLLELGESAAGKDAREAQMILNHRAAIELLVEQASEIGFNRYTLLNLHALLSDNLLADPQACGRLRAIPVAIGGTVYHPLEVPQLIEECFQQILDTASAIVDPFEQTFFIMVQLPYLQPFEDTNKRVSRLAANIPLIRRNLCPLSFVDVPESAYVEAVLGVYELNRIELLRDVFLWAYERSSARYSALQKSLGEPDPFRLRYREPITGAVAAVVQERMNKKVAPDFIRRRAAKDLPQEDRARFVEVVETELMSLHEGNIARYRLHPDEYLKWQKIWE